MPTTRGSSSEAVVGFCPGRQRTVGRWASLLPWLILLSLECTTTTKTLAWSPVTSFIRSSSSNRTRRKTHWCNQLHQRYSPTSSAAVVATAPIFADNNNNDLEEGPNGAVSSLPVDYEQQGNALIQQAASMCGVSSNQYQVEWKAGNQIVVTVQADDAYMSTILEDANSEDPDDEDDFIGGDFVNDDEIVDNEDGIDFQDASEDGAFVDTSDESESPDDWNGDISTTGTTTEESKEEASAGIDLVVFARAINAAFNDNGGIGSAIAARFAVEVTTPGGTDTLTTPKMFLAYQGFDIITTHRDPKTKSVKIIEARLVERNSDFLVLNIKGRVKKLKRSDVLSVKLPKAKKEKGVS